MDSPSEFLQQQALYTRTLKTPNAKLLHTYLRKNFRSSSSQIARRWPMILLRLWSQDVRHQLSSTLDSREKAQRNSFHDTLPSFRALVFETERNRQISRSVPY